MNLNHLAIFHAVALEQSVSRGAERLFISQPAASKQLGELERSLGMPLFDRLPRGVRLTQAGTLLFDYARRLFALETEVESALAEMRGLERGHLSLGASLTIGDYLLPALLAEFTQSYPHLTVSLEIANTEVVQSHLHLGTLDLGLTEGFADDPALETSVFGHDTLVAIAPPGHPLAQAAQRGERVTPRQLCETGFVAREAGSGTRAVVEQAFARLGLSLNPRLSLGSIEAVKRAVAAGAGMAIVSALAIRHEREAGALIVVPLDGLTIDRPLHRLYLRGKHQSRASQAFAQALGAFCARLPTS